MGKTYSSMSSVKSQAKRPAPNNFLEALRELSQDVASEAKIQVKEIISRDIPESFGLSDSGGTINPNESISLKQIRQKEFEAYPSESSIQSRIQNAREEERAMLSRHEAQVREQIKSIQDEIKTLAKSTGEFSIEIERATFQATINPGVYHKNFFSHLKQMIVMIRKQVSDSQHWLEAFNSRAAKKNYYWSQVGKSGTKFMLSSERYMVTSTG